jgi:hypothetical protein
MTSQDTAPAAANAGITTKTQNHVALCPVCKEPLHPVAYPSGAMLNCDQWDSVRAGDWYCDTCPPGSGQRYCYWWESEVIWALPATEAGNAVAERQERAKYGIYWLTRTEAEWRFEGCSDSRELAEKTASEMQGDPRIRAVRIVAFPCPGGLPPIRGFDFGLYEAARRELTWERQRRQQDLQAFLRVKREKELLEAVYRAAEGLDIAYCTETEAERKAALVNLQRAVAAVQVAREQAAKGG